MFVISQSTLVAILTGKSQSDRDQLAKLMQEQTEQFRVVTDTENLLNETGIVIGRENYHPVSLYLKDVPAAITAERDLFVSWNKDKSIGLVFPDYQLPQLRQNHKTSYLQLVENTNTPGQVQQGNQLDVHAGLHCAKFGKSLLISQDSSSAILGLYLRDELSQVADIPFPNDPPSVCVVGDLDSSFFKEEQWENIYQLMENREQSLIQAVYATMAIKPVLLESQFGAITRYVKNGEQRYIEIFVFKNRSTETPYYIRYQLLDAKERMTMLHDPLSNLKRGLLFKNSDFSKVRVFAGRANTGRTFAALQSTLFVLQQQKERGESHTPVVFVYPANLHASDYFGFDLDPTCKALLSEVTTKGMRLLGIGDGFWCSHVHTPEIQALLNDTEYQHHFFFELLGVDQTALGSIAQLKAAYPKHGFNISIQLPRKYTTEDDDLEEQLYKLKSVIEQSNIEGYHLINPGDEPIRAIKL